MSPSSNPVLPILWQDECLVAVNKPSGLLAIRDGYQPDLVHVRQLLEAQFGQVFILHRLDRETSGVMLLARAPEAHKSLNLQFENHAVQKTYLAIVPGKPDWRSLAVELPLRSSVGRRKRTVVDYGRGKPAQTILELVSTAKDFSLIMARPRTGRTHQIRAHLYAVGFPILGDRLYGGEANNPPGLNFRLALHAQTLAFQHPVTAELITIAAPLPSDFAEISDRCGLSQPDFASKSGKM